MASASSRNPEVDRWFAAAGHPLDATMRRAREIILGADGRVRESITWKTPTFAFKGNIASFNRRMASASCFTAEPRSPATILA